VGQFWNAGLGQFCGGGISKFTRNLIKRDTTGAIEALTLTARDVGGDGAIINSETYTDLDHGFALELPGGKYKLDVTDPSGLVLASYNNVVVDGDVKLAPTDTAAE